MRARLLSLLSAAFVLLTGTAYAATKVAGNGCCPPCPFCH
jgi:hypothetical protein